MAAPTRRTLFGGALGVAATAVVAAMPAVAAPNPLARLGRRPTEAEVEFVRTISHIHSNGFEAAIHALELGLDPAALYAIDLQDRWEPNECFPRLRFNRLDRTRRVWVSPIDVYSDRTGISYARGLRPF